MRKLGTVLAAIAAVLWSVAVWGSFWALGLAGRFFAENAPWTDLPPEIADGAALLVGFMDQYGTGATAVLWIAGLGVIWLLKLLWNAIVGAVSGPTPAAAPEPWSRPASAPVSPPAQPAAPLPPAQPAPAAPRWGRNASGE